MKGRLIVIDGADGVGKHTQTALLVERLRSLGKRVETIDFPQYDKNLAGALIKESLRGMHGDFLALDPYIASIMYAVDRYESRHMLQGWLDSGTYVVLDRYVSANQMHQGAKIRDKKIREKYLEWIEQLEYTKMHLPKPAITLYLDVPREASEKLIEQRGAKDDAEKSDSHQRETRAVAMHLIEENPTWRKIECATRKGLLLDRNEIHEKIMAVLKSEKII